LELEEMAGEVGGKAKLVQACAGFLRQVVRDLQVDQVRRQRLLAGPALLDDLQEFRRDVETPAIVPAVLKPPCELGARVLFDDVDVELALLCESRECQVAAAEKADRGGNRIGTKQEVQLRVQRMPQMKFHDDLLGADLRGQSSQADLVLVCGKP